MIRLQHLNESGHRDWQHKLVHSSPQHRIIWLDSSQARALLGPRMKGVGENSFLFVPALTPFALDLSHTSSVQILHCNPLDGWDVPSNPAQVLAGDPKDRAEISAQFKALSEEQQHARPFHDEAMRSHVSLVFVWLRRQMLASPANEPRSTASDRLISSFLSLLERSFDKGISMAGYAESLDVTPTHLSRVCKTQLGKSAASLITDRTLHAARTALEETNVAAKDIAEDLGFGSAAYFSRFILTHTGSSPRALRAQAREQHFSAA